MKMRKMNKILVGTLLAMSASNALAQAQQFDSRNLDINADAGIGFSSNAYRSPSSSYIDLAAGGVQVNPTVQSGIYVPLGLDANYQISKETVFSYKFSGDIYLGNSLTNASTYDHHMELDRAFKFKDGILADSEVHGALLFGIHRKTYYDRDTGEEKLTPTSGTNVSNRYNYNEYGAKGDVKKKVGNIIYTANGLYSILSYDAPALATLSSLDHTLLQLGGSARLPILANSAKLKLGYDYTSRNYSNRSARDAAGTLSKANGLLTYTYHDFSAQVYKKIDAKTKVYADVVYGLRRDNFVSYNDYAKTTLKLRVLREWNQELLLKGKVYYSNTDYANAFAFEDPAAAKKTSSAIKVSVQADYTGKMLRTVSADALWAKLNYKDYTSNDLRYNYNVVEIVVGGDWQF